MRRILVAWLLLGAACSSTSTSTTTLPPVAERLVVLTAQNELLTMNADGSDTVTLVEGTDRIVLQPTWSPGGERLAWTELVLGTAADPVAVITARPDGSDRTLTPVVNPPFYLSWSPQGERLALLRNGTTSLNAAYIDVAAGADEETVVGVGQPFYFSWDPDGSQIVANVGIADRFETIELRGTAASTDSELAPVPPADLSTPLGVEPGQFQAPAWVGDSLFWVRRAAGGQELVVSKSDGSNSRVLAAFEGFVHFVVSPDGKRVAYRVLDQAPPAVTVAMTAQSPAAGELAVVDVASGDASVVDADNAFAFFWSPDSEKLLLLSILSRGFAWSVWSDVETTTYPAFLPSAALGRDYLPFFDQFAQSIELWAPDSGSFVYGGRALDDTTTGVWVQPLDGEARRIGDGVFAAFAPAP